MRALAFLGLVTVAAALAGCVDDNALQGVEDASDAIDAPWRLAFPDGCLEGGFIAPYNSEEGSTIAGQFVRADIGEELDHPMLLSGTPWAGGPITGNWHQGFQCPTAVRDGEVVEDFIFGYVGQWVEPPAWDHGGADVHVHLTGIGMEAGGLRDSLLGRTTMDVTETTQASVTEIGPDVVSIYMIDEPKGTYEIHGPINEYRDVGERVFRFWWYVPTDGSMSELGHVHDDPLNAGQPPDHHAAAMEDKTFHPVWLDLRTGGGTQYLSPDNVNAASHNDEDAHGGATFYLPEVAAVYEHAWIEVEFGRVIEDVVLDEYHWH